MHEAYLPDDNEMVMTLVVLFPNKKTFFVFFICARYPARHFTYTFSTRDVSVMLAGRLCYLHILQIGKLKLGDVRDFPFGHIARKWQSQARSPNRVLLTNSTILPLNCCVSLEKPLFFPEPQWSDPLNKEN